jgi:hypothetical protein
VIFIYQKVSRKYQKKAGGEQIPACVALSFSRFPLITVIRRAPAERD